MHTAISLARQPIVDSAKELVGFELQFQSRSEGTPAGTSTAATSALIANVFSAIGLNQVIGPGIGFLPVGAEFLKSALVEALPPARIVLELDEATLSDHDTMSRAASLRTAGYRVALKGFVGNVEDVGSLLGGVDIVKVDFERLDPILVPAMVQLADRRGLTLVAENVGQPAQFRQAKELGIPWFQGFHFAVPEVVTAKRQQPARLALVRILTLIMNDAEVPEIEEAIKRQPTLAVNLLRLVNSAAYARRDPITSLRHALIMLGRRQLCIWLQLLLYTADRDSAALASPLMQLAAARGKLMEQLAQQASAPGLEPDLAFMTGILSLADALFSAPMGDILPSLGVPEQVGQALLERQGPLGALLALAESVERGDAEATKALAGRLPADLLKDDLLPLQLEAYRWASEVAAG